MTTRLRFSVRRLEVRQRKQLPASLSIIFFSVMTWSDGD